METNRFSFKELLSNIVDNRGKTCPTAEDGLPLIATNCIKMDSLYPVFEKVRYVSNETYENWFRGHPEPDDIIFVCKGSPGRVSWTPNPVNFCIAQDMLAIRANKDIVDQKFLFALLRSKITETKMLNMHVGTLIPHFKKGDFGNLYFDIPKDKSVQKVIGDIHFKICEKIELNRQMNQTLEQMAQALFQSWFVDFDPVIDNALAQGNDIPEALTQKAENRKAILARHAELDSASDGSDNQTLNQVQGDGKLPEDLQKRFPNKFTFNDTLNKWIPEGWEDLNLAEIIKIKHGYAFKGEFFSDEPTNDILLTPGNFKIGGGMKFNKLKYYNGEIPEDYILKKDDLIVTMTDLSKEGDTLGFPALVPHSDKLTFLHNQRLGKIEYLTDKVGNKFIYHCLCDREYRHVIVGSASGTTVKHTSPTKILLHNILFSGGGIEALFEKSATSMFEKIEENQKQTETLTQLREVLLPQLISGKLSVPEAMLRVEEVVG